MSLTRVHCPQEDGDIETVSIEYDKIQSPHFSFSFFFFCVWEKTKLLKGKLSSSSDKKHAVTRFALEDKTRGRGRVAGFVISWACGGYFGELDNWIG